MVFSIQSADEKRLLPSDVPSPVRRIDPIRDPSGLKVGELEYLRSELVRQTMVRPDGSKSSETILGREGETLTLRWHENGRLISLDLYRSSKETISQRWKDDGSLLSDGTWVNGIPHDGTFNFCVSSYESNILRTATHVAVYKAGDLSGIRTNVLLSVERVSDEDIAVCRTRLLPRLTPDTLRMFGVALPPAGY
jgi:hypothetical protein